jgi:hypothetical protein
MNKLVEEAPYHPGYEDAVVSPAQKYKGVDPAKMIWKQKPLSDEEIIQLYSDSGGRGVVDFARAILRKASEK